jgi:hypothetical protein
MTMILPDVLQNAMPRLLPLSMKRLDLGEGQKGKLEFVLSENL